MLEKEAIGASGFALPPIRIVAQLSNSSPPTCPFKNFPSYFKEWHRDRPVHPVTPLLLLSLSVSPPPVPTCCRLWSRPLWSCTVS